MLSPEAPWPATTGGLVRIAGIAAQLARHFDVTFVAPRRPGQALPADTGMRLRCPEAPRPGAIDRAVAVVHPTHPYHLHLYSERRIAEVVRDELATGSYAIVYGHFYYSLQYLDGVKVPIVIDQQNVDRVYWQNKADHSPWPVSAFAAWNTRRTIAYESRRLPMIWGYVSVSDEDREQTRRYAGGVVPHFWVGPNGVDTRRFVPAPAAAETGAAVTLGYLGSMDLQMNVEAVERFCRNDLPAIRAALPGVDVRFLVVGRNPAPSIRTLATATPGMTLSGTVDDVLPWLQRVDILVSPLKIGAGTKLKTAEAMACAIPVVGSPLAFAGLQGRSGEHYVVAEDGPDFVAAVVRLARSPDQRREIGRRARELAIRDLDWQGIGDRLAADITGALPAA